MARCGCASDGSSGCSCAVSAGANVTISGNGEAGNPWVINAVTNTAQVRAALSGADGIAYVPATGVISARLSTDANNSTIFGTDGGIYTSHAYLGMTVFSTAGTATWNLSTFPLAKTLRVRMVGGGGGSASTGATIAGQSIARGGGGGGSYSESWLAVATVGASVTVTVGAGGAGGTPAGTGAAGGTGGTSSFGAFVTAPGGGSSTAGTAPGVPPLISPNGVGGAVGVGDITIGGGVGGQGVTYALGLRAGGAGGEAPSFSPVGMPGWNVGTGTAGKIFGGGAQGPTTEGASGGFVGSAGSRGIVIVEHFG